MKKFSKVLMELISTNPKIFLLDNDLSRSSGTGVVRQAYPENFVNVGVAEQNSMGIAGGLALMGFTPIVHTFASFGSMRACEQVRTGIAYQNLNVKICVSKGGLAASYSGPTHHSTEDLAIMRAIPNMTVVAPKDFFDFEQCLMQAVSQEGPFYLRVPPEDIPDNKLKGRVRVGAGVLAKQGHDLTVIFTGTLFKAVGEVVRGIEDQGLSVRVIYLHTLKPLDNQIVISAAEETGMIVTLEEHNVIGGLGSAVAEVLAESKPTQVVRIGVEDRFCYESGPYEQILDKYCISTERVISRVLDILERSRATTGATAQAGSS